MSNASKHRRLVERIVEAEWSDFKIEPTGAGHIKVILRRGAREISVVSSKTASCKRAVLNFRGDVRRAAAALKEETR